MNAIPSPYTPPWDGVGKPMLVHVVGQHLVNNVETLGSEHASAAFWNKYRAVFVETVNRFPDWKSLHSATKAAGDDLVAVAGRGVAAFTELRGRIVRETGVAAERPASAPFPEKF